MSKCAPALDSEEELRPVARIVAEMQHISLQHSTLRRLTSHNGAQSIAMSCLMSYRGPCLCNHRAPSSNERSDEGGAVAFALEAALRMPDAGFGPEVSHGCGLPPWHRLDRQVPLSKAANTFSQCLGSAPDDKGRFDDEQLLYDRAPGLEWHLGLPSSVL